MFKTVILTISDRCFEGERRDESGPLIEESLPLETFTVTDRKIVPDDIDVIKGSLMHIVGEGDIDLVLTTGGTGFSKRDVTPEATAMVVQKRTPGIDYLMYAQGLKSTPFAALARAISGIRNKTLIINLPGNPKAVSEYIEVLIPVLPHALRLLGEGVEDEEHVYKNPKNGGR